jgi:hypothetical protein
MSLRTATLPLALLLACASAPTPPPAPPTRAAAPQQPDLFEPDPPGRDPLAPPADLTSPPDAAPRTTGGVVTKLLQRGSGEARPGTFSVVRVHYSGWTQDGQMFDSSVARGQPAEFALNGVIVGWRYGLKLMVPGEKRRLWIPEELAYKGQSGPQGMLVFDVELLEILVP